MGVIRRPASRLCSTLIEEDMALGGPALVMDEPPRLAQSLESMDDMINGTRTQ